MGEDPLVDSTVAVVGVALSQLNDDKILQVLQSVLKDRLEILQALGDWIVPDFAYPSSRCMMSRLIGTIKSFNTKTGFGFVTSPEILQRFGKDMFLSINQIEGRGHSLDSFPVGSDISFAVVLEKGKACAYDIAPLGSDPDGDGGFKRIFGAGTAAAGPSAVETAPPAVEPPPPAAVPSEVPPWQKTLQQEQAKASDAARQSRPSRQLPPAPETTSSVSTQQGAARYLAPVKRYNSQTGWGFLDCQHLEDVFGKPDIFVHSTQIEHLGDDFQPGQIFSFSLGEDKKGQAMAVDLAPVFANTVTSRDGGAQPERFIAPVKSFNPQTGFGFLDCPELADLLGKPDVFVHASHIEHLTNFQPGELFSFSLGEDKKGHIMAVNIEAVSPDTTSSHGAAQEAERFIAPVKRFNPQTGFGFLDCPELADALGKPDVFVHKSHIEHLNSFQQGELFSFSLGEDKKGHIMAVDLQPFNGSTAGRGAPEARRYVAPLKRFNPQTGFGFLECQELAAVFGKPDIFVHATQIQHFGDVQAGQLFSFSLGEDRKKGNIMAVDLELVSPAAADSKRAAVQDRRYTAPLKSFSPGKGFGFLDCPELADVLGKPDVFVHATEMEQFGDAQPGELFSFTLGEDKKKGTLMAVGLEAVSSFSDEDRPSHDRPASPPRSRRRSASPPRSRRRSVSPPRSRRRSASRRRQRRDASPRKRYLAPVRRFNPAKGFGFLDCPELEHVLGKPDIFVHRSQIEHVDNFQPGQYFSFSLGEDDKGTPMAVDLEPASPPEGLRGPLVVEGERYTAPVKAYNAQKRFGFLECKELADRFGTPDVFVHAHELPAEILADFKTGQMFSFQIYEDSKGAKAVDLRPVFAPFANRDHSERAREFPPSYKPPWKGSVASARSGDLKERVKEEDMNKERYTAPVKRFSPQTGFGFLDCPELEDVFGKSDIFVHRSQIRDERDFQQGRLFSFALGEDGKGKPMAVDLQPVPSDGRYGGSAPAAPAAPPRPPPPPLSPPSLKEDDDTSTLPDIVGLRFSARVKSYNADKRFGFLDCTGELGDILGKPDMFVHASQTEHLDTVAVGQTYSFTVGLDRNNQPMAIDLELESESSSRKRPKLE
eukprot:TRINITY_DN29856_c0_g1_i1.p1 TRINITY_DN29856_c0_g1~~TRINITY_DN29856_c0_g1_i1.p1  ORF type:complete len:1105 (+),score=152.00 TRINITY_DN29856_c0_g1_i1:118-3432(+)